MFLLDANRDGLAISYGPGWFDNRSFITSSDFPGATYYRAYGVSRIILLQTVRNISGDLQVLLQLQGEGHVHRDTSSRRAVGPPARHR